MRLPTMAKYFVSKDLGWVELDLMEKTEADTLYVNTTGDTLTGDVNMQGNHVLNAPYSGAGPAGAVVTPTDVSTIQYADDLFTVSTTAGVPSSPPLRDGQIWMVVGENAG